MRSRAMSRRCMITGKGVLTGNNVSHANNKTRRRFLPAVQDTSLYSEALQGWVKIKASAAGLRTVEHMGGFDAFLKNTAKTKLDPKLRGVKDRVEKALAQQKAA
jgi:large subunit ribosomal protein L28